MVLSIIQQLEPRSVLDVGIGFGKWGHLFREYLDIVPSERDPDRYNRPNWQVTIDGIEGFPRYITPAHRYFYNELFLGDMRHTLPTLGKYDVVFIGDAIEHIEKEEGILFLRDCLRHSNKALIVTTPAEWVVQDAVCDNPLEIHRSFWTRADFHALGRGVTAVTENSILVAALAKEGIPIPLAVSYIPPNRETVLSRLKRNLRPVKPILQKIGIVKDL
jgi:SAM-dependent methyltransferase